MGKRAEKLRQDKHRTWWGGKEKEWEHNINREIDKKRKGKKEREKEINKERKKTRAESILYLTVGYKISIYSPVKVNENGQEGREITTGQTQDMVRREGERMGIQYQYRNR